MSDIDRGGVDEVDAGDAEVGDLQRSATVEHQVLGLHVAMQDALLVHVVQTGRRGQRRRDRGLDRHARGAPVGERAAGEQLHHEQPKSLVLAVVVDRDDVGMVELGEDPCLAPEARARLVSR